MLPALDEIIHGEAKRLRSSQLQLTGLSESCQGNTRPEDVVHTFVDERAMPLRLVLVSNHSRLRSSFEEFISNTLTLCACSSPKTGHDAK